MDKYTVLIVDDNEEIPLILKRSLDLRYRTFVASDGAEGLRIVQDRIIHLIISDIMMPEMDGFEFCEKIKSNIDTSHIPIILLTAKNTLREKIEGLGYGAEAYIEKPFSVEYLEAQIESLLQNRIRIKKYFTSSPLTQFKSIALNKTDEDFLESLQYLIEENLLENDLDIDFLAAHVHMSRTSFYRKIKSVSNLSPKEMIDLVRLKKAAELISEGIYNLNEITAIVGFTSLTHFGRRFKKQFGILPSDYAKKIDASL